MFCEFYIKKQPISPRKGQQNRGQRGYSPPPPLFQICELGGLASHSINLGTLACNITHIYLDIKPDI